MPIEAKLCNMLENENKNLQITLLAENGVKADLNAELKKTKSGHVAMDVKDVSHVGEIANKKCLVSVFKTSSGYKLGISKKCENCNAVLTTSSAGGMRVVLKEDARFQENNSTGSKSEESVFRVRTKNTDANPDTTLIRATSRGNYEFILDKEFETRYKKVINEYLGDNTYCYVNVSRTTSGTYVIDFGENYDNCDNNPNALLEKSDSGSVMLTECTNIEAIEKQHPSIDESSKKFKDLYKQLSSSIIEFERESIFEQQISDTASGNALQFDEDIIITIRDRKHLVAELSVSLNRISSGKYCVIFKNKFEGLFVANLLDSWNGWLPIQSATKRQVLVYLNRCMKLRNECGWLKRTPDGEILVEIYRIATGVEKCTYPKGTAVHGEMGVTTTCHGNPDDCDCDKTKCICNELPLDWTDRYFHPSTHNVQIRKSKSKHSRRKSGGRKCSDF